MLLIKLINSNGPAPAQQTQPDEANMSKPTERQDVHVRVESSQDNAVDLLKPGGKLMVIGIPEFDRWSFPVDKSRHKELCIQNVRRQNEAVQPALDMMLLQ